MLTGWNKTFALVFLAWNFAVFLLFALDKHKAIRGQWRISEKTLLTASFLLGGLGGMAGMLLCRHKTKHLKFRLLIPLALIVSLGALAAYLYFFIIKPSGLL